jgi:hypothetical protein
MASKYSCVSRIVLLPLLLAHLAAAADRQRVPFVIPAIPDPASLAAYPPGQAIAVDAPRVVVANSHFSVGGKPIKFWGVNLTFAANFPEHADAEQLAVRLSQAGINCVRLHHMDMKPWNGTTGIWDPADPKKLSPEALDRLDFLLDQLARHGIYADLNLHVSRTHSAYLGLPAVPGVSFDKMTDLFMPQIIEAQKDYARELIGHVNKYRGVRFGDDPAIAIVEISNEDSLFEWGAQSHLEALPEPYAKTLQDLFCDWLGHRYGSTSALRAAWDEGMVPLGQEMIADREFKDAAKHWFLEVHDGNAATMSPIDQTARVQIPQADGTSWHIQFQQGKLHLDAGQYYTLNFTARADHARQIGVAVGQAHDPWGSVGLEASVAVGEAWKNYTQGFVATSSDDQVRVCFQLGASAGEVDLKNISLRLGGREGLREGESLETKNIALFGGAQTERRALDSQIFLADTQKAFFDGMAHFIKDDLDCHALVTGTIVYGPLGLFTQSDMDFVDAHAYWHHPEFPGREWDMHDWIMRQVAMVDHPEQATVFELASSRLAGKPFTVTEYCHPAPNDYQAECVPEIATFAAAQDWDAVFLFDWGAVPSTDHFESFFDVGSNPAKLAFMSSGARIFRDGGVKPLADSRVVAFGGWGIPPDALARAQTKNNLNMAASVFEQSRTNWQSFLTSRLYLTMKPGEENHLVTDDTAQQGLTWKVNDHIGMFTTTGPSAFVWVGHAGASTDSPVTLNSPQFAAITLVATDGLSLRESKRLLITSCGRCENTGMKFVPDRHTLEGNFGIGPALIEPVEATILIPGVLAQGDWSIQPLNAAGRPIGDSRDLRIGADGVIHIGSADQSAWHLLTRN